MVSISRNLGASDGMQQYKGREPPQRHRIRGSTWRALVGDDKFKGGPGTPTPSTVVLGHL